MQEVRQAAEQVIQQLERAIYGKRPILQLVLTCLLADGRGHELKVNWKKPT